jgi:hypothetical protein
MAGFVSELQPDSGCRVLSMSNQSPRAILHTQLGRSLTTRDDWGEGARQIKPHDWCPCSTRAVPARIPQDA